MVSKVLKLVFFKVFYHAVVSMDIFLQACTLLYTKSDASDLYKWGSIVPRNQFVNLEE